MAKDIDNDVVYAILDENDKVVEMYHKYEDADTRALELQLDDGIQYRVEYYTVY